MTSKCTGKSVLAALGCLVVVFALPSRASAQYNQWFTVDCSGNTPGAYTSINSILPIVPNGSGIFLVPGTSCTETVNLTYRSYIWIGTNYGSSATLNGSLYIDDSEAIYVESLNVRTTAGDGISVGDSRDVRLDACSSSYSPGNGLTVNDSSVTVQNSGTYDFNGGYGIWAGLGSTLSLMGWSGLIDMSSNTGRGLSIDRSGFQSLGNVSITHNGGDYGLDMEGRSTGLMMPIFGPNLIAGNPGGGIHSAENSQISLGGASSYAPYMNTIQGNGPVGISMERSGQLTLFGEVLIEDHTSAGIELTGNSQGDFFSGQTQIVHNGYGADPLRAGILVDDNSEAYVRLTSITQSGGPGILTLMNSSADVAESTFNSNLGGDVECDSSAVLSTDLTPAMLGRGNSCKTPSVPRTRHQAANIQVPDWHKQKANADRIHALVSAVHH